MASPINVPVSASAIGLPKESGRQKFFDKGDFGHWRRKVVRVLVSPSTSICVDGEAMAIAPVPAQHIWVFLASFFLTGLNDPHPAQI